MAAINDPGGTVQGICSAQGWVARYRGGESKRLACWAFFKRDDGADSVVGLLASGGGVFEPAERVQDFSDYHYQG